MGQALQQPVSESGFLGVQSRSDKSVSSLLFTEEVAWMLKFSLQT